MCKINKKKVVVYATLSSNLHNKLIADMKTPLIIRFFIIFILFPCLVFAQKSAVERPKLVVGIVVDQMRWDYFVLGKMDLYDCLNKVTAMKIA